MIDKKTQIEEILRCGNDPIHFINMWTKIQHPTRGLIPFKTFDFQNDCVNKFESHKFNIIVKARQLGLSTITAAYALWLALFRRDKNILVIATKLKTAQGFLKKVKIIFNNLPKWLSLTKLSALNKTELEFDNGSRIEAIPTGENAARGEALSLLIIDEAAFIHDLDDLWAGLFPTVSEGGKVIMISTPNGVGGFYYKQWIESEAKLNEFNPTRLMWDVHPHRDSNWFAKITRNMSQKKIAQEYLCEFLTSGETFVQAEDISYIRDQLCDPILREGPNEGVWVWRNPEPGRRYVISADVARGDSNDYSTFHIIDSDTCEVVAEFMGLYPPDQLANLMIFYGKRYNNALLCPENNSFGHMTAMTLRESGYENLFYEKERIDIYSKVKEKNLLPGFSTQAKSRLQILNKMEEMIRNRVIVIHSKRFYDEVCSFAWSNGKAQAIKGTHDDLIMSLSIGVWIMDVVVSKTYDASDSSRAALFAIGTERRTANLVESVTAAASPLVNPSVRFGSRMYQMSTLGSDVVDDNLHRGDKKDNKNDKRNEFDWLF